MAAGDTSVIASWGRTVNAFDCDAVPVLAPTRTVLMPALSRTGTSNVTEVDVDAVTRAQTPSTETPIVPAAPNPVPVIVTESPILAVVGLSWPIVGTAAGVASVSVAACEVPPPCGETTCTSTGPVADDAGTTARIFVLLTLVTKGDLTPSMMTDGRPAVPKPVPVIVMTDPPVLATDVGLTLEIAGRAP